MWNRVFLSGFLILATLAHTHAISSLSSPPPPPPQPLRCAEVPYYIVSAIRRGGGGGVSMGRRESSTSHGHTPTVKQSSNDMNMGTPVMFFPSRQGQESAGAGIRFIGEIEEEEMMIQQSMDMNIGFSGMNDTVWQVEERRQHSSGSRYVTLKGKLGHPGESTVRNWFKMERMSKGNPIYRIVYCPNVCESCYVVCGRVGIINEDGNRWLSVSEHRDFPFVFVRAHTN